METIRQIAATATVAIACQALPALAASETGPDVPTRVYERRRVDGDAPLLDGRLASPATSPAG